jgi:homoserine dehydrogenase
VRLSVGIELAEDLVADLRTALDHVVSANRARAPRQENAGLPAPSRVSYGDHARRAQTDVVVLGVGAVGRELLKQVSTHGKAFRVCGLVDRSGYVFNPSGISSDTLRELRTVKARGGRLADTETGTSATAAEALAEITTAALWRPILVDATAADTASIIDGVLANGWDVVLANKVPLAADRESAEQLQRTARLHGRRILHEATVGAGLPVIDTLRKLQEAGDTVLSIEGCPSGTLGFIFGELSRGRSFSDALRAAVSAGYTEPDPRTDLSGIDVARKALILARLIGFTGNLRNIAVESLVPPELAGGPASEFLERLVAVDAAWAQRARAARERGSVLRYRAHATPNSVTVGLVEVATGDPLGSLRGPTTSSPSRRAATRSSRSSSGGRARDPKSPRPGCSTTCCGSRLSVIATVFVQLRGHRSRLFTLHQWVEIGEQPGGVLRPQPHVQVPELERVLALEIESHDARRRGVARPDAVGNDVLDPIESITAVGQAFVEQNLGTLDLDLRVDVGAIDVVKAHRAMVSVREALPDVARISRGHGGVEGDEGRRRRAREREAVRHLRAKPVRHARVRAGADARERGEHHSGETRGDESSGFHRMIRIFPCHQPPGGAGSSPRHDSPFPPSAFVTVGTIDSIIGRPFSMSARTSAFFSDASWSSLLRHTSVTQISFGSVVEVCTM